MSTAKFKEIIFERIPNDIFLAHEALGVFMAIADASDFLKQYRHSHVFGIIQRQALGSFILSLCKLYEGQNRKYPNYSIPTALEHFHAFGDIAIPTQSIVKLEKYICTEIDSTFDPFDPFKVATAARMVHTHFKELCPRTPPREGRILDITLDALKVLRDKREAHYEDHSLEGLTTTDLESALELLCFAKTVVNIIGYGFFGFSLKAIAQPVEFDLARSKSGVQMKKIIQELGN